MRHVCTTKLSLSLLSYQVQELNHPGHVDTHLSIPFVELMVLSGLTFGDPTLFSARVTRAGEVLVEGDHKDRPHVSADCQITRLLDKQTTRQARTGSQNDG